MRELDLRVATLDELYARVAERAATLPEGAWVLPAAATTGTSWAPTPTARPWTGRRANGGHRLQRTSCRMGVASTAAFALMGFPRWRTFPTCRAVR